MTKSEFIQQACISMAGKVIGNNGIADADDWVHVVNEATKLATEVEEQGYGFDDESDTTMCNKDVLYNIADRLERIEQDVADGECSIQNRLGQIATDNGIEKAIGELVELAKKETK